MRQQPFAEITNAYSIQWQIHKGKQLGNNELVFFSVTIVVIKNIKFQDIICNVQFSHPDFLNQVQRFLDSPFI